MSLSGPALYTFFRIAELWDLSVEEQMRLLDMTDSTTFYKWKKSSNTVPPRDTPRSALFPTERVFATNRWEEYPNTILPRDTLERISYIIGIYKALQILLPDEKAADEWVKRPNKAPLFKGKPALHRMLSGKVADLSVVRQYLDAQRQGGWV